MAIFSEMMDETSQLFQENHILKEQVERLQKEDWQLKQACGHHDLYKTGDTEAPEVIKDGNGEVVLGLCKKCGRGEIELSEPCDGPSLSNGDRT